MPLLRALLVSSLLLISLASINSLLSYALVLKSIPKSLSRLLFISTFTSRSNSNSLFKSLFLKSLLLFKSLSLKSLLLSKRLLKSLLFKGLLSHSLLFEKLKGLFSSLFLFKSYLTIYNLYIRYAPLKSLIGPVKVLVLIKVLPHLILKDLFNKFALNLYIIPLNLSLKA